MLFSLAIHARTTFADMLSDDEKSAVLEAASDFGRLHQGYPLGVPSSYDWFSRSILKHGNQPGPNKAMTGWGHAFWAKGSGDSSPELQLRAFRVYLCSKPSRQWKLVQSGPIYGRQFNADFKSNTSYDVPIVRTGADEATVAFARGSAFHFWPKADRVSLTGEQLCGVVVMVQARVRPAEIAGTGRYLVGLGADYWRDRTSSWNGKDSNPGIALGRLKYVSDQWTSYALNTASVDDTARFVSDGFDNSITGR